MQVFDNWSEQIRELLVGLLICRHHSDLSLRHLNATFNTHLYISTAARRFLLHTRPDIATKVALEQRVACLIELRVRNDWNSLRKWSSNLDTILVQLLLRY